ncbi:MAG TPA: alpha,alpha-trehalase TreA [Steroidobacteraceae bacterium]|nr:alpha,alpha-trehalase TreA [Steroidobacteraceae bacterium]
MLQQVRQLRSRAVVVLLLLWSAGALGEPAPQTPVELFGELFVAVQVERVFDDSKFFADAVPKRAPDKILADYKNRRAEPGFQLLAFVQANFELPAVAPKPSNTHGVPAQVADHIDSLWRALTRPPAESQPYSSLLALPAAYVVPGGRFREIYYWDSYFTMLGLEESSRHDLTLDMLQNFASLIERFGHIPNGNRSYYLSRSQPPFFAAMVRLAARRDGASVLKQYLEPLEREYAFWMDGVAQTARGEAHRRVVRLKDGSVLNRYWDDRDTPREEAYREDVATARDSGRPAADVYRNLRAAAESGWDFSSRWFADGRTLATIHTVDLVPVDLNCLLYELERTLAAAYRAAGNEPVSRKLDEKARARRTSIRRYLWSDGAGAFGDYDWRRQELSPQLTAATLYPLYFDVASPAEAARVAKFARSRLLQPDGLATTTVRTGQQWDAPNGWAPLQWIGIDGLRRHGDPQLARVIACRWIRENLEAYRTSGKLVEKYDVSGSGAAGGGEYPLQDGFGWTNGVLRKLLSIYPDASCAQAA